MAFKRYHTVDGLLLGETGASGRRDYLPDAVGSVTATVDPTATVKNTYRFKPYGAFLVQGGPEADPKFLWTGETGSRNSGAPHAGQYNRARTYARETGRWTSVDPLWPNQSAYGYVEGNPVGWLDPSGEAPASSCANQTMQTTWEDRGTCCATRLTVEYRNSPGSEIDYRDYAPPTSSSSRVVLPRCYSLMEALRKCGFRNPATTICEVVDDGKCIEAAREFGVSAGAVCGVALTETSYKYQNGSQFRKNVVESAAASVFIPTGGQATARRLGGMAPNYQYTSVGCAQLQPNHAQGCLKRLKRCNPGLWRRVNAPESNARLLQKLATDCAFSMRIVAACAYVNTKASCGGTKTFKNFNSTWNPGAFGGKGSEYQKRSDCARDAALRYLPR